MFIVYQLVVENTIVKPAPFGIQRTKLLITMLVSQRLMEGEEHNSFVRWRNDNASEIRYHALNFSQKLYRTISVFEDICYK